MMKGCVSVHIKAYVYACEERIITISWHLYVWSAMVLCI